MSEVGNGEKGRIIPFEKMTDLETKIKLRTDLEKAAEAIKEAYEGRGENLVPDTTQKMTLQRTADLIKIIEQELMEKPLTPDVPIYIQETLINVRTGLSQYLSDNQFVKIFGTDKLA